MKNDYCPNCHYPIKESNQYCGNCGQKNRKDRIRLFDFLKDLIASVFNWDAKIWVTPIMLFKPGFLTQKFFEGKRKRYTNPGKLLLFTLVVYFTIFLLYMGEGFKDLDRETQMGNKAFAYSYLDEKKDSLQVFLENEYADENIEGISDSIAAFLKSEIDGSFSFILGFVEINNISHYDLIFLSEEELFEKYNKDDLVSQSILKGVKKVFQSPGGYMRYVLGRFSWIILSSIPFLALILMLLYFRQKRYLIEHVVFLVHINTFIFLLGIVFFLIGYIFNVIDVLVALPYIIGMVYIFPAMKIFYNQGYLKTFIKYMVLVTASFNVFFLLTVLMFGVGILLF